MRPTVVAGPWLLRPGRTGLEEHRRAYGPLHRVRVEDLLAVAERNGISGRGGGGFPLGRKLRAVAQHRGRKHVVVNFSEGEPASAKDAALAMVAPHLVLDGAEMIARALRAKEIHLAVPDERPWVGRAIARAIAEREAVRVRSSVSWTVHTADARFVSGESSAVTELINGRENLPVTSWVPTAQSGVAGRPTLLSNAETFAQLAAALLDPEHLPGDPADPGTRLLSVNAESAPITVVEVPHGTPWQSVLGADVLRRPILLGGFHGSWLPAGALIGRRVSTTDLAEIGVGLGAGIVIPLGDRECPLRRTATVVRYLAGQSARRCGPCFRGLPALADRFEEFVYGGSVEPVLELAGLVDGRGACFHPDGTARLVRSALAAFPEEVEAHRNGFCPAHLRTAPRPVLADPPSTDRPQDPEPTVPLRTSAGERPDIDATAIIRPAGEPDRSNLGQARWRR